MTEPNTELRQEFEELLREKSQALQDNIERGQLYSAVQLLQEIQDAREQTLYHELGRLTRALHEAITNFNVEPQARMDGDIERLSEMSDATDRLDHVVKMTEDAANRTMDKVDEAMPLANEMGRSADELRTEWQRLVDRDMSAQEFRDLYWRLDSFLGQVSSHSGGLYQHLSDILLAQDFQDLTGQLIQRVTGLVRDVEQSLVDLMRMASKVEGVAGLADRLRPEEVSQEAAARGGTEAQTATDAASTDQAGADNKNEFQGHGPTVKQTQATVSSQDDVDDLLSSLGF